ncbi:lipase family protein [Rhodococcus maanshanensis]|uniref:Triacylglycerol lipase n=1 Tax=Rhodococcus maanshanensis TaxID=183556 RepID=A0A1H7TEJ9_9NOCA|nr:lipase family protein [Rhodococcus maanshanensis]SEL82965.1 triacylglycerol lipase [Rhodococcus maanshanensis]
MAGGRVFGRGLRRVCVAAAVAVMGQVAFSGPALGAPAAADAPGVTPQVAVQPPLPFPVPPKIPEFDAEFYSPPAEVVASKAPGEIIAARQVHLANFSVIPLNVDAWQVSYRSNNGRDEAIPAVATVIKPRGGTRDGAPRPLLSFQMAEDSLGRYCAPSYVMQQASVPWMLTGAVTSGAQFLEVQAALAQGWAVVVPDHQGPNSSFAAGPVAGRITLDGIRAAENFAPMQLNGRSTKVGMVGYSGGSIPTGHAAELRKSYAPELDIVGAAAGGVAADLGALVENANNALGAGIVASGVIGVSREDPELAAFVDERINPVGRALFAAKDNLCVAWNSSLAPLLNLKGFFDGGDPLQNPVAKKALARTAMGTSVPDMPVYIYQSNPDWLVPVGPVNKLVGTYCQDPSASVTYTRDHFSEHLSLEVAAVPSVILWMRDRFAGVPAQKGCSTTDVGSIALDSKTWPVWVQVVGEELAGLFGKPIGA